MVISCLGINPLHEVFAKMDNKLIKLFSKMILNSKDGELHLAFLMAHSFTTDEFPTMENTRQLTRKSKEFKKDYLKRHFQKHDEVVKIILNAIGTGNRSMLYPYLKQYWKITQKKFSIWTYLSSTESPFSHPNMLGGTGFELSIIDSFRGRQPLLLSNETIFSDKIEVSCLPQIILDSQILSYINWYVNDPEKLHGNKLKYIRNLIQYFVKSNYLYSPFFYYFEAINKGSTEEQLKQAFSMFIMLLCLNSKLLLKDGVISLDNEKVDDIAERFKVNSFDALVDRFIEYSKEFSEYIDEHRILIDISYCILVKIVLIQKNTPKAPLKVKIEEFQSFLENYIQAQFSYETAVAICYFCGHFQNFLKIQKTTKYEKAKKILLSCSWDLLLLRQPDLFLAYGQQDFSIVSCVCTNDKALYEISKIYSMASIIRFTDDNVVLSTHQLDDEYLINLIGNDNYNQIESRIDFEQRLSLFDKNKYKKLSEENLLILEQQLESELS